MVAIRYQFGHFFCEILELLITKVNNQEICKILNDNLLEEKGFNQNFPGLSHSEGRKQTLTTLGIDYESWEPKGTIRNPKNIHIASEAVILCFVKMIENENWQTFVSALATSESLVPSHYRLLTSFIEEIMPSISRSDLSHLYEHMEHDVYHGQSLDLALMRQPHNYEDMLRGRNKAVNIWNEFWITIFRDTFNGKFRKIDFD